MAAGALSPLFVAAQTRARDLRDTAYLQVEAQRCPPRLGYSNGENHEQIIQKRPRHHRPSF